MTFCWTTNIRLAWKNEETNPVTYFFNVGDGWRSYIYAMTLNCKWLCSQVVLQRKILHRSGVQFPHQPCQDCCRCQNWDLSLAPHGRCPQGYRVSFQQGWPGFWSHTMDPRRQQSSLCSCHNLFFDEGGCIPGSCDQWYETILWYYLDLKS
jgi:hypothetical protein